MLPLTVCAARFDPRDIPEIVAVPQVVPPTALIVVTKLFAEHADAPPYLPKSPSTPIKASAFGAPETYRFVVDAVTVVNAVVLAYGSCEATVELEKKDPPFSHIEVEVDIVDVENVGFAKLNTAHVGHDTVSPDTIIGALPSIDPGPATCAKTMFPLPMVMGPTVVSTHVVPPLIVPDITYAASPASISDDWSKSVARVIWNTAMPDPTAVTVYMPFCVWSTWFFISTRSAADGELLSSDKAPTAAPVSVAPTPDAPLAYITVGSAAVLEYFTASLKSVVLSALSTYSFVAASWLLVGSDMLFIWNPPPASALPSVKKHVAHVSPVVDAYGNTDAAAVEDAVNMPTVCIDVVVAALVVPMKEPVTNGYPNVAVEHVGHVT